MEESIKRSTSFKLGILWMAILLLGSFWLTVRGTSDPVSLTVIPQAPREGEPIIAIFKLNNSTSHSQAINYQFYADGELLSHGTATLAARSSETFKHAYTNPLQMGKQLNFIVRTQSEQGSYEKVLSSPAYPPQVWSSFVSFASFSTSVMSSISTMTYYQSTFGSDIGLNVGIIASVVLIALLIFIELTQPVIASRTVTILRGLRIRLSTVTWILFIIFIGIVYTKVVMILAT
jgi:hypothetical protein